MGARGHSLFALTILAIIVSAMTPSAIPPAPIDPAFQTGNEKDVTTAIVESDTFKRAVKEAVKARDVRKGEIGADPRKSIGISPTQAARVRFIEVLQGK